ncbi:hypothetical protein ACFYXF_04225 [Streptomyces sp. NPDC002680]|uniref:S10 family serine carboxypeptidase-like protein n=1 Tax=Streptomyces sp. NPDC002680 TaxID=3364659 RepID=UPI003688B505
MTAHVLISANTTPSEGKYVDSHYETERTGKFRDREVAYTVSLDLLPANGASGEQLGTASVFSYVAREEAGAAAQRPVVFLFNGGPGTSSVFLHFSGIGPLRAGFSDDLDAGNLPPYVLEESPSSVLATADLVFIDPVNSGLGRVLPGVDGEELFSVEGDARCFADLIGQWLSRHGRWQSPKYLVGESYGTIRAAFVATALHSTRSIPVDGIVLLSQIVNLQDVFERPGNITGALASLPYQAATAWYHKVGSTAHETPDEAALAAVEFGVSTYATALARGNRLGDQELHAVADALSKITGIPAQRYVRDRLWLSTTEHTKSLLPGRLVGAPDSRYTSAVADSTIGEAPFDAAYTALIPAYAAAVASFVHSELGVPTDVRYRVSDPTAVGRWDWEEAGSERFPRIGKPGPARVYPYPAQLTKYLKQVRQARLFIGTGLYDSVTTVGTADHLLRQYPLPEDRVVSRWYRSGHMMYSDADAARALADDLDVFFMPCLDAREGATR